MENLNEKHKMQKQIDLNIIKLTRNKVLEQVACSNIISFFKNKENEKQEANKLAKRILEQISDACSPVVSTSETEEHRMLTRTQGYLKIEIDKLEHKDVVVKENTFEACIQYLKRIAQAALTKHEEQVKDRLDFFINELKERYNETE